MINFAKNDEFLTIIITVPFISINSLKIYVRYLKELGIELKSNELIEQDRKTIGDFANYIVFREAINNR